MKKAVFGIIVTTRGFFNPELARRGRLRLLKKLHDKGHETVSLEPNGSETGLVETYADSIRCAELFRREKDRIDGIIISIPNFGDETSTVEAMRLAELDVPVLVHAFDDRTDLLDLENRRDSFCGKISICANLKQYGIRFTNTTLHTCDVEHPLFDEDLTHFNAVCQIYKGLKNMRVAQIGVRPAAFQTVRASEKLLQKSGITVVPVDTMQIIHDAEALEMTPEVRQMLAEIRTYGRISASVPEERLVRSAKLTVAIEQFMQANRCTCGAIQCWDTLEKFYGCAACLPMSILTEHGIPMACETDIMGAVSMAALTYASGSPSALMDWNNNFNDERDKCILIHCGNFAKSFYGCEFEISNLDILGKSLGFDRCFGACKAQVAPGHFTFGRISTNDLNGGLICYLGEGEFTEDKLCTPGSPAVARIGHLQQLMDTICKNGFEHHVALNRDASLPALREVFETYMGWTVIVHA